MTRKEEVDFKLQKVRAFLSSAGYDGLLVTKWLNFAWLSGGGDNHVVRSQDTGVASLLVTQDGQFLCTDNIESPRIQAEEIESLGFTPAVVEWYAGGRIDAIKQKTGGMKIASDTLFPGATVAEEEIARLHWSLLPVEIERYRALGGDCARAITETCTRIRKGMTEWDVAADVSCRLMAMKIEPAVVLIAADDRIRRFRHPIPTNNPVNEYCMVVICGQRHGLVLSMTRLVHFGPMPDELKRKHQAVAEIDATTIAATQPGCTAGDVFKVLRDTYAKVGFPDEWTLHHQGGAAGYAGRYWKAGREDDPTPILENQAFAWNPSITGTKSEDTVIVTSAGYEVLCPTPEIPTITVETPSGPIKRSDILIM